MNNSSDKKGRKIASYLIPGIITLLVMIFVLIVREYGLLEVTE